MHKRISPRVARWIPAVVATALVATAAVAVPFAASAVSGLPTKTPQQVLELALNSSVRSLSATVQQTSDLGIPALSGTELGGSAAGGSVTGTRESNAAMASALGLLTGSYSARVYVDGAAKERVQVIDKLAERDVIRNGSDVWTYSSKNNTAVHSTLSARTAKTPQSSTQTPQSLAKLFLTKAGSSTTVTVGDDLTVAGRSAYNLVLTPTTTATLVGSVSVAVDSATGLPLAVTVKARGQKDAAFSTKFTDLTIGAPEASLFNFTPPKGATVTQHALKKPTSETERRTAPPTQRVHGSHSKPVITGAGWSSVAEIAAGTTASTLTANPLFDKLTTAVIGGRLAHTSLVNVLVTTDGRVFAGAVDAATLEAAAAAQ